MVSRDGAFGILIGAAIGTLFLVPAQAAPQEISPKDRAAIEAGPVVTLFTIRPELRNQSEVVQAYMREFPAILRDGGVGATVEVWFYISDMGQVLHGSIAQSSGQALVDDAALRVAAVYQFTPAMNYREEPLAVWIKFPITFEVR